MKGDRLRVGKRVKIVEIGDADAFRGMDQMLKPVWTIIKERPYQSTPGYVACNLSCKEHPEIGHFYAVKLKLVGDIGRNPL